MTKRMIQAYKFFRKHAGGIVGRDAQTALNLARAEHWMSETGAEYSIEPDWDADLSWMTDAERKKDHECVGVCLRNPNGDHAPYSLWGIVDADSDYLRVIVAELASEAMADGWMPQYDESEELTLA